MTDEAIGPLRRRMIEDMTIRKFAPKTQHDYFSCADADMLPATAMATAREKARDVSM